MTSLPHCTCGEFDFVPNVEAYEVLGELLCDDCALDALAEDAERAEEADGPMGWDER